MTKRISSDSPSSYRSALNISLAYAIFSSIWILFSDQILLSLTQDVETLTHLQMFKGWAFVIISAIFIYFLLVIKINQIKHTETSFQNIFRNSSAAILISDSTSGKILALNQSAINLFGYSEHEAKQLTLNELQLDIPPSETLFDSSPNNNKTKHSIWKKKSNESFWGEVSKQSIQITDKTCNITTINDISDQKRNEEVLRVLAETATLGKDDIFKTIVRQTSLSLNVRFALIGVIDQSDKSTITTLAAWDTDHFLENLSYSLAGSPCEHVTSKGSCVYQDNAQQLFPEDEMLITLGIKSYIGVPLKNNADQVLGLIAIMDDKPMDTNQRTVDLLNSLTVRANLELERIKADEQLKLSARVFTDTHEGILITDTKGIIVDVNPTFCDVTEYDRQDVIGHAPSILNSGNHSPAFYSEMWHEIDKVGRWQGEVWNRKKGGELYVELLTISSLKNEAGDIINYIGIFTDITKNKKQQQQLETMAHYDVLTQLPNRILFADRFKQASAHSKRFETLLAICFLDLDGFKPVNDTYGHNVGDKLLVEVAERITNSIREEDTVSRQGGDEFAILLVNLESPFHSQQMLERIQHDLAQPFYIDGNKISISSSMGVTLYPTDDSDLDTLLRHADQAMYQTKLAGRNNYQLFNLEDDQQIMHKHHHLQEISDALINDQLCLYYQPKVNMRTGVVYGVEALIRWQHPQRGLVPPLEFLPIIEGNDLEIQIGNWVIEQALKQMNTWLIQGISLQLSINISSQHLLSSGFVTHLNKVLTKYPKIDSQNVQLEILESSVLGDLNGIRSILNSCQNTLGISFALDDFGTGYSSLTHLRNLPVNIVKIDQEFVKNMLDDPNDFAIIDGVIGLSNSFNRDIIAEGVETTEHGLMLLIMGCDYAQGYGISRPMPAKELPEWLNSYTHNDTWKRYVEKHHSHLEKRAQLCRLTVTQWQNKFKTNLLSNTDDKEHWPILNAERCHCSTWIAHERQEQIISAKLLDKIDKAHQHAHNVANTIFTNHQKGDKTQEKSNLTELDAAIGSIFKLLDLCVS
jgi:diguanylate cyclase (GGDEF)-like protein/PAS domain S-box-containing protein